MLVDRMEASNAVSKMEEEEMVSEETSGVSIESIKVGWAGAFEGPTSCFPKFFPLAFSTWPPPQKKNV